MEDAASRVSHIIENSAGKRDIGLSTEINNSFKRSCRDFSSTGCCTNLAFAELKQGGHEILETSNID